MKTLFTIIVFLIFSNHLFSQSQTMGSLEAKARFHASQLKENKTRSITPTLVRTALDAVIDLSLASVVPDTITFPSYDWCPAEYPEGVSMYKIRPTEGWPFNGTLIVERGGDGHATQKIINSSTAFPDERKRASECISKVFQWTKWDIWTATFTYDWPSIPHDALEVAEFPIPGSTQHSQVKRLIIHQEYPGMQYIVDHFVKWYGDITVFACNTNQYDFDLPEITFTVYIAY